MAVESLQAKQVRMTSIVDRLKMEYPDSKCSLNYKSPFQLLVATILSAQCTDKRVNQVTRGLFEKYPDPPGFINLSLEEIEREIYSTGFYKNNKNYFSNNISNYIFIANWSLSETPIKFRKKFYNLIKNSQLILICFQEKFEKINNLKYFQNMEKKLKHNFKLKIIKNEFYKGNIFNYQKHYFLIGKKL